MTNRGAGRRLVSFTVTAGALALSAATACGGERAQTATTTTTRSNAVTSTAPVKPEPDTAAPTTTPPTTTPPTTAPPTAAPTSAPATPVPPTTAAEADRRSDAKPFVEEVRPIDETLQARIVPTSWREGCPVPLSELRYLRLSYWGTDGAAHEGELIVNASVVDDVTAAFRTMFDERFPLAQMRLVDDYGGDDFASVAANNTSAFNCRLATGSSNWSRHAYGLAIDINPLWNPYVEDGRVIPAEGAEFVDRSREFPGKIDEGGVVVNTFDSLGWSWGGRFATTPDWQHFSKDGG